MAEFLILFREGLEIVLILGIMLTWLHRQNRMADARWIAWGTAVAVVVSVLGGILLATLTQNAANAGLDKLVEAIMLFVAAGFILYLVVWLGRVANPAALLHSQLNASASPRALFIISFLAVAREGMESVTFLYAAKSATGSTSWLGVLLGLGLALLVGYGIFATGRKLPLKTFFRISNATLVILAAGMATYGTHELETFLVQQQVIEQPARAWNILPPISAEALGDDTGWYSCKADGQCYHLMHHKGNVGVFFKTFTGYRASPSYAEPVVWILVLALGLWLWLRPVQAAKAQKPQKPAPASI